MAGRYRRYIVLFICAVVLGTCLQAARWYSEFTIDENMWASEGHLLLVHDPEAFNGHRAYGHPGGTLIEGTLVFQKIFNVSDDGSLKLFLSVFNGFVIGLAAVVGYALRRDWWWIAMLIVTFGINRLYFVTTPTSAIAGPLLGLLALVTLYMYQRSVNAQAVQPIHFVFWGVICGLSAATRTDITVYLGGLLFLSMLHSLTLRRFLYIACSSLITFAVADPFMWFMPVTHVRDIIGKIFYHYAEFTPGHLSFTDLLSVSSLAGVSILLSVAYVYRNPSTPLTRLTYYLYGGTLVLYTIFLTAHFQARRYFFPIVLLWEIFLPLYFFYLADKINFTFMRRPDTHATYIKFALFCVVLFMHVTVFAFVFIYP